MVGIKRCASTRVVTRAAKRRQIANSSSITNFPDELLLEIFQHVESTEKQWLPSQLRAVSKRWSAVYNSTLRAQYNVADNLQSEIDYLLQNQEKIVSRVKSNINGTNSAMNSWELERFNMLIKHISELEDGKSASNNAFCSVKLDNLLTKINLEIIRIRKSQSQRSMHLVFHCYNQHLTRFPKEAIIEDLPFWSKIYSVMLGDNHLTCLPNEIELLINATYIDIKNNQLQTLPDNITKLDSVKEHYSIIYLQGNKLKCIPDIDDRCLYLKEQYNCCGKQAVLAAQQPLLLEANAGTATINHRP